MIARSNNGKYDFRIVEQDPEIAFEQTGRGETIIFLHGVGANRTAWYDQLEEIGKFYHAVAWDVRGYGASGDYTSQLAMDDINSDLLALIENLGVSSVHLVGHSMGGIIAQDFYSQYPERVRSLTLTNTTKSLGDAMTDAQIEEFIEERRAPLQAGMSTRELAPVITQSLVSESASEELFAKVAQCIVDLRGKNYIQALEMVMRYNPRLDYASVNVPTLIIASDQDALISLEAGKDLERTIPGAEYYEFKGVGHIPNMEDSKLFNHVLLDFLVRVS